MPTVPIQRKMTKSSWSILLQAVQGASRSVSSFAAMKPRLITLKAKAEAARQNYAYQAEGASPSGESPRLNTRFLQPVCNE